jgi:hypothetical protein
MSLIVWREKEKRFFFLKRRRPWGSTQALAIAAWSTEASTILKAPSRHDGAFEAAI